MVEVESGLAHLALRGVGDQAVGAEEGGVAHARTSRGKVVARVADEADSVLGVVALLNTGTAGSDAEEVGAEHETGGAGGAGGSGGVEGDATGDARVSDEQEAAVAELADSVSAVELALGDSLCEGRANVALGEEAGGALVAGSLGGVEQAVGDGSNAEDASVATEDESVGAGGAEAVGAVEEAVGDDVVGGDSDAGGSAERDVVVSNAGGAGGRGGEVEAVGGVNEEAGVVAEDVAGIADMANVGLVISEAVGDVVGGGGGAGGGRGEEVVGGAVPAGGVGSGGQRAV